MMARRRALRLRGAALAAALLAFAAAAAGAATAPPAVAPKVVTVTIHSAISGGTVEILTGALARARAEGASAVVVTLDTPGGQLDATRDLVRMILDSEIPVVIWVGPAGAQAASAGVFVTLAGSVAAMHPTSNIGAAHPVTGTGRDVEQEAGKDMARKVENDAAAFARSVASARGRNADWAEKAVRESVSVTADEAVKQKVVDLLATDIPTLLAAIDGRTVKVGAGERRLATAGAVLVPYEPTVRQRLLTFLSDPNVMALLTLLGLLGIAIEFYHPGAVLPGAAGAICLFLAFLAMRVIPVNVGAVLLVVAGVGLLVAEAFITTHGLAGAGGAALIVLGMLFFVDTSSPTGWFDPASLRLSAWVVWPTPIALTLALAFMAWNVARARRRPLQLGAPAMLGRSGNTLSEVGPAGGEVFVHGEYWRARSDAPIPRGARVRVTAVNGLVLTVVDEGAPKA